MDDAASLVSILRYANDSASEVPLWAQKLINVVAGGLTTIDLK